MSMEEVINLRDLETEKLSKIIERIFEQIEKDDYRMVLKYKQSLGKTLEKWESYHLLVANRSNVNISDTGMRKVHQEILDQVEKAEYAADNYYNDLKRKKKEEKKAEREKNKEQARSEQEIKIQTEKEVKMPILKDFFKSEMIEINKIMMDYLNKINNKRTPWVPDGQTLYIELLYLDDRFLKALSAYNQFNDLSFDPLEIANLREFKNTEERKYRESLIKIKSFGKLSQFDFKPTSPQIGNLTLMEGQTHPGSQPNISGLTPRMANERVVMKSFEDNITSLSMDDRHVLVGLSNGKVGCYFSEIKKEKFVAEVSTVSITAVLADNFDVRGNSLFYAGDQRGYLYVLGEKGDLIHSLKVRDGPIFAIQDVEAKKVWVYSDKGRSVVVLEGKELKVRANKNSKFSMDLDSTFHLQREKGDFPLEEFDAKVPSRVYGTPRIMMEPIGDLSDPNSYVNVYAYATDSEQYRRELIEDNKAPTTLEIVGKGFVPIRSVEMKSPIKQVLNCYVKNKETRTDALYVLTNDDKIIRFRVSELLNENISDESLSKVVLYADPQQDADYEDLGDIETFTCRKGKASTDVIFAMRDTDDVYLVEDAV